MNRRSFVQALASAALLPSMAWARGKPLEPAGMLPDPSERTTHQTYALIWGTTSSYKSAEDDQMAMTRLFQQMTDDMKRKFDESRERQARDLMEDWRNG